MKEINKNITVPNALTLLRILLIPAFVFYFIGERYREAGVVLAVSGLSDLFDGMIARKFDQITVLGQMLDPLADKLTQATVAFCMAVRQPMLIPLLAVFIVKEGTMIIAGCVLIKKKKRPCAAKWYGKVATAMFYGSFTVIYALKGIWNYESLALTITLLSLTVGMMVYAFIRYFQIYRQTLHSDDPRDRIDLELKAKRTFPGKKG